MNHIELLDYNEFAEKVSRMEGGHWTPETIAVRWDYHARVVNLIKALNISVPTSVLEMGTMGVNCVKNGHTIDYAERWDFPGKQPNYLHDARILPWPIEAKQYELFIALRVFQHLVPVQRDCVLEAMRIAKKIIILVPNHYDNDVLPNSKGITYSDFVRFLDGVHPNIYTPTEMGDLYFWDTERPSRLNIESVMNIQKIHRENSAPTPPRVNQPSIGITGKIKRKLKSLLS